nr:phytanoyl-CoA dioxygenase family protein [Saccharothrix syringae]
MRTWPPGREAGNARRSPGIDCSPHERLLRSRRRYGEKCFPPVRQIQAETAVLFIGGLLLNTERRAPARRILSDDQFSAYERDGFIVLRMFDADEVSDIKEEIRPLLATPTSDHPRVIKRAALDEPGAHLDPVNPYGVFKVFNTPLINDFWFDMMREPRILGVAADLVGPDVNFLMGWLHQRVPGLQVHEGWHCDFSEDRHTSTDLVTAILYLDEMTPDSGPTLVVPGSHRDRLVEGTLEPRPVTVPEDGEYVPVTVPAGSVLFLHSLTVHSLSMNRTRQDRSILLQEYKSASAVEVEPYDYAFADLPLLRGGEPV